MVDKVEIDQNVNNGVELTENQIFEKIKEDLNPIQENLSEKKITVNEARTELKKINEWVQGTGLEKKDKKEIGKAFDKLTKNLEKSVDSNYLQVEIREIVKLLEKFTKKDLVDLKHNINKNGKYQNVERSIDVQKGINESSNSLNLTINEASEDRNLIASGVGKAMKRLNS